MATRALLGSSRPTSSRPSTASSAQRARVGESMPCGLERPSSPAQRIATGHAAASPRSASGTERDARSPRISAGSAHRQTAVGTAQPNSRPAPGASLRDTTGRVGTLLGSRSNVGNSKKASQVANSSSAARGLTPLDASGTQSRPGSAAATRTPRRGQPAACIRLDRSCSLGDQSASTAGRRPTSPMRARGATVASQSAHAQPDDTLQASVMHHAPAAQRKPQANAVAPSRGGVAQPARRQSRPQSEYAASGASTSSALALLRLDTAAKSARPSSPRTSAVSPGAQQATRVRPRTPAAQGDAALARPRTTGKESWRDYCAANCAAVLATAPCLERRRCKAGRARSRARNRSGQSR